MSSLRSERALPHPGVPRGRVGHLNGAFSAVQAGVAVDPPLGGGEGAGSDVREGGHKAATVSEICFLFSVSAKCASFFLHLHILAANTCV